MVLFNKCYTEAEIDHIDFKGLDSEEVLSVAPLRLHFITSKRWKIIGNRDPVACNLPMFKLLVYNNDDNGNDTEVDVLIDFGYNRYRLATSNEVEKTRNYFTSGPIYFENLLVYTFLDSTILDNVLSSYFINWDEGSITEGDMVLNADLYHDWTGFGSDYQ